MIRRSATSGRDPVRKGRVPFAHFILFSIGAVAGIASCAPVGQTSPASAPARSVTETGGSLQDRVDTAIRIAEAGQADSARVLLSESLRRSRSPSDSASVYLGMARVESEDGRAVEAIEAADRAIDRTGAGSRTADRARLVAARAAFESNADENAMVGAGLDRLLALDEDSNAVPDAVELVEEFRIRISVAELTAAADRIGGAHPVVGQALAGRAERQVSEGTPARAAVLADEALRRGATGASRRRAESLIAEFGGGVTLGMIVSEESSPALQSFSALIREGVEIALSEYTERTGVEVDVRVVDDRGLPRIAGQRLELLEEAGVVGIVGPLQGPNVRAAAGGRSFPTTLVSPTARGIGDETPPGVYSLQGLDPGSVETLAQHLVEEGASRIVVMHPNTHASRFETRILRSELSARGSAVLAEIPYDSSLTFLRDPVNEMIQLRPDALVLPMEGQDIEILAPQMSFFGVDTLEVQLYGTAAWASSSVLQNVDPRHTSGVVVAAFADTPGGALGTLAFRQSYERYHQKSLRSEIPALGYDAALLVLTAVSNSGRTPRGVRDWFDSDSGRVEGASGSLYVRDGRIVRDHAVRVLYEGRAISIEEARTLENLFVGPGRPGLAEWREARRGGGGGGSR